MIKVWKEEDTKYKDRLFHKLLENIKEANTSEDIPVAGAKNVATTMMSKKIGKNLYISPNGVKYRKVVSHGKEASKTKTRDRH